MPRACTINNSDYAPVHPEQVLPVNFFHGSRDLQCFSQIFDTLMESRVGSLSLNESGQPNLSPVNEIKNRGGGGGDSADHVSLHGF